MPDGPASPDVDKITLDRAVFKALASDTRLDILKALDVRQKTVTELAKELELNKATVFEHLEKLAEVDLIQKLEDERKWVYWQLTWKGRRLLHPETITLALLLSSALGTLLTAAAAAWMWIRSGVTGQPALFDGDTSIMQSPETESRKGFDEENSSSASGEAAPAADPQAFRADEFAPAAPDVPAPDVLHDPVYLAVAVVMGLVFLALVGYAAWYWRKRRAHAAADTSEAPPAA